MPSIIPSLEKIGLLSEAGGTISLAASVLTVGGRQFITPQLQIAVPVLVANDRFFIYVVLNPIPELVISQNVNSAGPAGFNGHKLVGAFRAGNTLGTFNKFLGINGEPRFFSMLVEDDVPILSPSIANGVISTIRHLEILNDSDGNLDTTTGIYTVPENCIVDIAFTIWPGGTFANNGRIEPGIRIDDILKRVIYWNNSSAGGSNQGSLVAYDGQVLSKDQTVRCEVRPNNWTTVSITADRKNNWFSVAGRNSDTTPLKDL